MSNLFVKIIDNADSSPAFVLTGSWSTAGGGVDIWSTNFAGPQRYFTSAGVGTASAAWTFTGVPSGSYNVYATWNSRHDGDGDVDGQAATDTPFKVYDDASLLATVPIDQTKVPVPSSGYPKYYDLQARGVGWKKIGTYTISSGTCVVSIADTPATGRIWADAVRLADASLDAPCTTPATFTDDFAGAAIAPSWGVTAGTWAQSSGVLAQTDSTPAARKLRQTAQEWRRDHVEILAKVRVDAFTLSNGTSQVGVAVDVDDSGSGYVLAFSGAAPGPNSLLLANEGDKSTTALFTWSTATWYWFRLRKEGTDLKGRVWADGGTEPGTWTVTAATTGGAAFNDRTTGYPALVGNNPASFDDVTITQWDSATGCGSVVRSHPTLSASGVLNGFSGASSPTRSHPVLTAAATYTPTPVAGTFAKTRSNSLVVGSGVFRALRTGTAAPTRSHATLAASGTAAPPPQYAGGTGGPAAWAFYKCDATSGFALVDSSGNGRTAALTSGSINQTGMYGRAVSLASSGYISLSTLSFTWTPAVTVALWYNGSGGAGTARSLFKNTTDAYGLSIGTDNKLKFTDSAGTTASSSGTIATGAWTHLAVTIDGSGNLTLYINGVSQYTGSSYTTSGMVSSRIGFVAAGSPNGLFDEFRIHTAALSAGQIANAMNNAALDTIARSHPTVAASGTVSGASFAGTAAPSRSHPTLAASGVRTVPVFAGSAAAAFTHPATSGAGTYGEATRTGSAALSQHPVMGSTATIGSSTYSGSASLSHRPLVAAAGDTAMGATTGTMQLWLAGSEGAEWAAQFPMKIFGHQAVAANLPVSIPLSHSDFDVAVRSMWVAVQAGSWRPSHADLPCSIFGGDDLIRAGLPLAVRGGTARSSSTMNLAVKGPDLGVEAAPLNLYIRGGGVVVAGSLPLHLLNVPPASGRLPTFVKGPDGTPGAVPSESTMNLHCEWGPQGVLPLVIGPPGSDAVLPVFVAAVAHAEGPLTAFIEGDGGVIYSSLDLAMPNSHAPVIASSSLDVALPHSTGDAASTLTTFINGWSP